MWHLWVWVLYCEYNALMMSIIIFFSTENDFLFEMCSLQHLKTVAVLSFCCSVPPSHVPNRVIKICNIFKEGFYRFHLPVSFYGQLGIRTYIFWVHCSFLYTTLAFCVTFTRAIETSKMIGHSVVSGWNCYRKIQEKLKWNLKLSCGF